MPDHPSSLWCFRNLQRIVFVSAVVFLGAPDAAGSEAREWKDKSGKFSIKAEFIEVDDGVVQLKSAADGRILSIPLEKLAKADQEFVNGIITGAPVIHAITTIPQFGEFKKLYPACKKAIYNYPDGTSTPVIALTAYLHDRYALTIKQEVTINAQSEVTPTEEPQFILVEIPKAREGRSAGKYFLETTIGERTRFEIGEWKTIFEAKGDLSSLPLTIKKEEAEGFRELIFNKYVPIQLFYNP